IPLLLGVLIVLVGFCRFRTSSDRQLMRVRGLKNKTFFIRSMSNFYRRSVSFSYVHRGQNLILGKNRTYEVLQFDFDFDWNERKGATRSRGMTRGKGEDGNPEREGEDREREKITHDKLVLFWDQGISPWNLGTSCFHRKFWLGDRSIQSALMKKIYIFESSAKEAVYPETLTLIFDFKNTYLLVHQDSPPHWRRTFLETVLPILANPGAHQEPLADSN
ncbi:unnamed protein product, partial [Nesidiocoris tenuis]